MRRVTGETRELEDKRAVVSVPDERERERERGETRGKNVGDE